MWSSTLQLRWLIIYVLNLVVCSNALESIPTCDQVGLMKTEIRKVYKLNRIAQAIAIRMGFHTCVGGCRGCINLEEDPNKGLEIAVHALEEAYLFNPGFSDVVSRADFWALATMIGIEMAIENVRNAKLSGTKTYQETQPDVCFDYQWGRPQECVTPTTDKPLKPFVNTKMNASSLFEYFHKEFKLNLQETTALLGVHSVRAFGPSTFGNIYYQTILNPKCMWKQKNVAYKPNEQRWRWFGHLGNKTVMMLNPDMSLFFDLKVDEDGKCLCDLQVDCVVKRNCGKDNVCGLSPAFYHATVYSQNEYIFDQDFARSLEKLLRNKVNVPLTTVGGTCDQSCM